MAITCHLCDGPTEVTKTVSKTPCKVKRYRRCKVCGLSIPTTELSDFLRVDQMTPNLRISQNDTVSRMMEDLQSQTENKK